MFDTLNPKGEMYAQEELWPNWSLCGCILDEAWRTGAGCRANACRLGRYALWTPSPPPSSALHTHARANDLMRAHAIKRTGVRSTCAATSPRFTRLNKPADTSLGPIGGVACGSRRALRSTTPFALVTFS